MSAILRCVCTALNIPPRRVLDPKGTYEMIDDWWGAARNLLAEPDIVHTLQRNIYGTALKPENAKELKATVQACNISARENEEGGMVEGKESQTGEASTRADVDTESGVSKVDHSLSYTAGNDGDGYVFLETLSKWIFALVENLECREAVRPLRNKESALRVEYNTMNLQMWNLRNEADRQLRKVSHLRNCLSDAEEDLQYNTDSIKSFEAKLLVSQLVAWKTRTGHSAIIWACMRGEAAIVQLLIEHGACVNFDSGHHDLAARAIQVVARHFLDKLNRPEWTPARSHAFHLRDMAYIFALHMAVQKIRNYKRASRLPLIETLYNGELDVARVLIDSGAKMWLKSFVHPVGCAPMPYPCHRDGIRSIDTNRRVTIGPIVQALEDDKALSALEAAEMGVKHLGAATWRYGSGWERAGKNQKTLEFTKDLIRTTNEKKEYRMQQHNKKVQVHKRGEEERRLAARLGLAVNFERWEEVTELLDEGAPIDHVNAYGHTALTMAAGQESYSINPEGENVLTVVMLLDRPKQQPQINKETGRKHTALTWAAKRGKMLSIEALLNHDADVNFVLSDGKTALIHAAMSGKWEATRLLVERGANVDYRDHTGKTAAMYAVASNFVGVARKLSQFLAGNIGDAKGELGTAVIKVVCPNGCGAMLRPQQMANHEENLCPKRIVP